MIKHVVMWRLHEHADGHDKPENALRVKRALENLQDKIDGLIKLEVGINELGGPQAFDLVLLAEFRDWQALDTYRDHPLHQDVIALLNKVRTDRVVTDWEA
jgi:hypothetical protein